MWSVYKSYNRSPVSAEDERRFRERLYLTLILDQQTQVMLPADRPQIKAVCSDSRKCHGCQTQVYVISLALFLYLATLSARVISSCSSPWQHGVWSRFVSCLIVVTPVQFPLWSCSGLWHIRRRFRNHLWWTRWAGEKETESRCSFLLSIYVTLVFVVWVATSVFH